MFNNKKTKCGVKGGQRCNYIVAPFLFVQSTKKILSAYKVQCAVLVFLLYPLWFELEIQKMCCIHMFFNFWKLGLLYLAWISSPKSRQRAFTGELGISILKCFNHKLWDKNVQLIKLLNVDRDRRVLCIYSLAKRRFSFLWASPKSVFLGCLRFLFIGRFFFTGSRAWYPSLVYYALR